MLTNRLVAPAATTGAAQVQCNNSVFTLTGNNPAPGTGLWTYVSGFAGASITAPTLFNTTVTGLTAGNTVTYQWTISNGSCPSTNASITLTNNATPPVADAGVDIDQCNNAVFTLAGNNPAPGTGAWTYVSGFAGASVTSPALFNSGVTGLTAGNSVTFRWTISSPTCANTFDDVMLTNRLVAPAATTGAAQVQCNNSVFTLTGNNPAPGTGLWTYVSGFAGASITAPTLFNTTVTGLTAGNTVTYQWTISNGSCPSTNASITLTNNATPPVADAGVDIDQCTNGNFTLGGNSPVPGSGTWTNIGGFAGVNIITPGSPSSAVTNLPAGQTVTLRWTITNGSCAATSDDVTLTNRALANPADAGTDQSQCNNTIFTLAGNDPSPGTGLWTVTVGSAVITAPNLYNTTVTSVAPGTSATLQWTISNGSCLSTNDIVILTNDAPPPVAAAGPDIDQCGVPNFTLAGNAPAPGTNIDNLGGYVGVVITTPSSATTTVTGLPVGNNVTLRWTITNGSCSTTFDDVTLTNRTAPAAATAGPKSRPLQHEYFHIGWK